MQSWKIAWVDREGQQKTFVKRVFLVSICTRSVYPFYFNIQLELWSASRAFTHIHIIQICNRNNAADGEYGEDPLTILEELNVSRK